MFSTIGAGLIALIVFLSYLAFDQYMSDRRRKDSMRVRIAADGTRVAEDEDGSIGLDRELSGRAKAMSSLLRVMGVNVDETTRKLEVRFARAGIISPDAPIYYLFYQRVVSIGLLMIALMFLAAPGHGSHKIMQLAIGGLIAMVALFGAYFFLENSISRRKAILTRSFPDTLDLLLICVESGLALDASLNRVCGELGRAFPEMTQELNRTRLELALLNDRTKALSNLSERTDLIAFRALTAALIQSERFGTSLTDTLRVLSEDFRLQRLTKAEEKAARLPVLLTIPLIFLLMPAFLLIVLGPAIIGFMRDGGALTGN